MKQLFLWCLLISFSTGSWAQNSFHRAEPISTSGASDPWDLNKYVWSHAHHIPTKNSKPLLDFDAIENWMTIGGDDDFSISANGKYFAYSMQNAMYRTRDSMVVQSIDGLWRQSFAGASPGFFSMDNKQYILQDKDKLCFVQLGGQIKEIKEVASCQEPIGNQGKWVAYQLNNKETTLVLRHVLSDKEKRFDNVASYSFDPSGTWLAGQLNNTSKELVIYNLATGKEHRISSVIEYLFDAGGRALVLKTLTDSQTALQYISLAEGVIHTIWQTTDSNTSISSFILDNSGKQVVFMVEDASTSKDALPGNAIWYYQAGMDKAILKVSNQTAGIDAGLFIQGTPGFTWQDNRYIQFNLQSRPEERPLHNPNAVNMDIWSYKDTILQSTQSWMAKQPERTYIAIIHPKSDQAFRLEGQRECLTRGDFAVISKSGSAELGDRFWEPGYTKDSIWLVSLKNGSRTLLNIKKTSIGIRSFVWFSTGGNYLVYFDAGQECNYFSYNLTTGKCINMSSGVPGWQLGKETSLYRPSLEKTRAVGIAAWLEQDGGLLVYDEYFDIWQLDLTGKKPPANITGGYGRRYHTRLMLPDYWNNIPVITEKDTIILASFNTKNQQTGIYRKVLGKIGYPELLHSGSYKLDPVLVYSGPAKSYPGMLKAADVNAWIVKRQRADEAPNYFITHDFKRYQPLTNVQPEKKYNWLTAELHSFKQLDGTLSQGILYKPENFDPTKKYPAILVFYGTLCLVLKKLYNKSTLYGRRKDFINWSLQLKRQL